MNNKSNAFIDNSGKLIIEDARILYRNFRGEQSQYNHEGDRNFCVFIDNIEQANMLNDLGWNIKIRKPRDEEDEISHYLKVNVSYRFKEPKIFLHASNNVTEITQETVSILDDADIIGCDMVINPSHWERGNDKGISAYLDTLHVVIQPDYFAEKYSNALFNGEAPEDDD